MKTVAVIDIGKTNAKLALVDLATQAEIAVLTQPNRVVNAAPYPHFDTEALWRFITAGLAQLAAAHPIDGISITTHGACAAWLAADGTLSTPVLDYEHTGPDETRAAYEPLRPPFAETGSPALPHGLNLGAQFHWLLARDPGLAVRTAHIVTWPQYWAYRLTGKIACDLCSIGCHTDLWNPTNGTFSTLPAALGLSGKIAPPRKPGDVLGTAHAALDLGPIPVLCGIHDSNASLFPHILASDPPFSVVSTGTWVVVMAIGAKAIPLDPARDTLINVNALGQPVPSARFMGGREYDMILAGRSPSATSTAADSVLARSLMLLPSVLPDSGPFQGRTYRWTDTHTDPAAEVALGYYLALMTATCLENIGAQGPTLIEGPFAANPWFCAMLHAATQRTVIPSTARTGTAIGAAMLFLPPSEMRSAPPPDTEPDPRLVIYAARWLLGVSQQ